MTIVLDSGALFALERNDKPTWAALKLAALDSEDVLVPSAALAQIWRGTATFPGENRCHGVTLGGRS